MHQFSPNFTQLVEQTLGKLWPIFQVCFVVALQSSTPNLKFCCIVASTSKPHWNNVTIDFRSLAHSQPIQCSSSSISLFSRSFTLPVMGDSFGSTSPHGKYVSWQKKNHVGNNDVDSRSEKNWCFTLNLVGEVGTCLRSHKYWAFCRSDRRPCTSYYYLSYVLQIRCLLCILSSGT